MTRGFVTIATGSDQYYRIAANLLNSYRLFSSSPLPFALICDRRNRYSDQFDLTVILEDPLRSYVDKVRLPEVVPFDETIFIDADCLAFRDLNDFWGAFEGGPDFSVFGKDLPPDAEYGWFRTADMGKLADRIRSIPEFIGGVYFLRKTERLAEFNETCRKVLADYRKYRFRQFEDPCDEPTFALAMALHGFTTAGARSLPVCFYPHAVHFEADIGAPSLRYDSRYHMKDGIVTDGYMVHWGSGVTRRPVYLIEEYKLRRACAGGHAGRAEMFFVGTFIRTKHFLRRAARKVLRTLGLRR